jgi:NAD(P)-dependent dehydrogenase (short-subunit alcohol dehydrogenase family)
MLLISKGGLRGDALANRIAVVTGGGTGIGFECARSLAWLGARVILAEIDKKAGSQAEAQISREVAAGRVTFMPTDIGDTHSVKSMADMVQKRHGAVDIIVNNAAIEPVGAVSEAPIESWDSSYRVNLRGPVLMAKAFLPAMLKQNSGVFVCVSSVGGAYMGPYEVLKRAQVELASTIDSECDGTGVIAFSIGPGLVLETQGASQGIAKIAKMMGKTVEEFTEMSKAALISVEAAGAGFAAAVALAPRFRGQETSSQEALRAAGIEWSDQPTGETMLSVEQAARAAALAGVLRTVLEEQFRQWQSLGIFQRGWMLKDFAKRAGLPIEKYIEELVGLKSLLESGKSMKSSASGLYLGQLAAFFQHMQDLTNGFVKDEKIRDEQLELQRSWEKASRELLSILK